MNLLSLEVIRSIIIYLITHVSHLIWTVEHSLTIWGNTLFRRSMRSERSMTPSSRLIQIQKMTQSVAQQTDSLPEDDTQSAAQQTDSLSEDDTPSAAQQNDSLSEDDAPAAAQQNDSISEDDAPSAVLDEIVPSFPTFMMLSVRDVKQLIQNAALKSCSLDPMPSTLVSKCEDLVPVLTKIIDNSLQSGPFPDIWKEALVFPLLKKPGLDVIFKMFRPISNLSFVSKLIERDAFNQIHGHLVSNNLHPVSNNLHPVAQSAHRKNHSTETAPLKVTANDIL